MTAKKKSTKKITKAKPENVDLNPLPFIPPKRIGRFSTYDPKFCELLIDHMSKGLSFEGFAGAIGCGIGTLYEWKEKHPEFQEAHKQAKSARRNYDDKLLDWHANNGSAACAIFKMKSVHKMTDDVIGLRKLKLLELDKMTPEEVKELAIKYLHNDKKD